MARRRAWIRNSVFPVMVAVVALCGCSKHFPLFIPSHPTPKFVISPPQAPAVIDHELNLFDKDLFSNANAAAARMSRDAAQKAFSTYNQWVRAVAIAVKVNTDTGRDYDRVSAGARIEMEPYLKTQCISNPSCANTDLMRREVEAANFKYMGKRLMRLFHNQSQETRDAAAGYLVTKYSLPAGP